MDRALPVQKNYIAYIYLGVWSVTESNKGQLNLNKTLVTILQTKPPTPLRIQTWTFGPHRKPQETWRTWDNLLSGWKLPWDLLWCVVLDTKHWTHSLRTMWNGTLGSNRTLTKRCCFWCSSLQCIDTRKVTRDTDPSFSWKEMQFHSSNFSCLGVAEAVRPQILVGRGYTWPQKPFNFGLYCVFSEGGYFAQEGTFKPEQLRIHALTYPAQHSSRCTLRTLNSRKCLLLLKLKEKTVNLAQKINCKSVSQMYVCTFGKFLSAILRFNWTGAEKGLWSDTDMVHKTGTPNTLKKILFSKTLDLEVMPLRPTLDPSFWLARPAVTPKPQGAFIPEKRMISLGTYMHRGSGSWDPFLGL